MKMDQHFVVLKDPSNKVTSEVYASRNDIVDVAKVDDVSDGLVVQITLKPDFRLDQDYLVRVVQKGDRTQITVLAGNNPPTWATFPDSWRDWVNNKEVQFSAANFIWGHLVGNPDHVTRAQALYEIAAMDDPNIKTSERRQAWLEVAELCGIEDANQIVGTGSRTASLAIPIRIAQKLSKGRPKTHQWQPPVARPLFADPLKSRRVRVAPTAPQREAWLFRNPGALASVQRGLQEAAAGKVSTVAVAELAED
jgi:hypothetical protein